MPPIYNLRQLDLHIAKRIEELNKLKEVLHKQLISLQVMELSARAALRKCDLEEKKEKECEMALSKPQSSSSAVPSFSVHSNYQVYSSISGAHPSKSSEHPSAPDIHPSTSDVHPSTSGVYSSFESRQLSPARLSDDETFVCLEPLDLNFQKHYNEEVFVESEDEDF